MNKRNLRLWYLSVASFGVCVFPFVVFMFTAKLQHMLIALACIAAATVFYLIMTRLTTDKKLGFTALHALELYKRCEKEGLTTTGECRNNAEKLNAIGKAYEHTAKFGYKQLLDVFAAGKKISEG